jgi:hypothetical protein
MKVKRTFIFLTFTNMSQTERQKENMRKVVEEMWGEEETPKEKLPEKSPTQKRWEELIGQPMNPNLHSSPSTVMFFTKDPRKEMMEARAKSEKQNSKKGLWKAVKRFFHIKN